MPKKSYEWGTPGKEYPFIRQHSIAKHEILKAYLIEYFKTLTFNPGREIIKLTLIDGFAGGGAYLHEDTRQITLGSPFIMLDAVKEAEASINATRTKPLKIDADFVFIEKNRHAYKFLEFELKLRGYESLINDKIFILNSEFQKKSADLVERIVGKTPRARRAIFLLDQYGYSEISPSFIQGILSKLPGSEIILTYAVDSLINYISDSEQTKKLLEKIETPDLLRGKTVEEIKSSERDWRLFIQSMLYQDFVKACGAQFFTSFFIRSDRGHGDYWLLHFSQQPKARDVMAGIHWDLNNYFIHYGDPGLDMFMLGYFDKKDDTQSGQMSIDSFQFDNEAKELSISTLHEEIPQFLCKKSDGMRFDQLFTETCNWTPATSTLIKESIVNLAATKEIDVFTEQGKKRKRFSNINDSDQIVFSKQLKIF